MMPGRLSKFSTLGVWNVAQLLMEEFGSSARRVAVRELLQAEMLGDREDADFWRTIARVIENVNVLRERLRTGLL